MLKTALVVLAAALLVQATHAQGVRYVRGDTVRLVAQENGEPRPDSRIVAIAGDGVSAELLNTVAEPWDQLVPEGHYFVVGESGTPNDMVRYYGLIPAAKIVRKV